MTLSEQVMAIVGHKFGLSAIYSFTLSKCYYRQRGRLWLFTKCLCVLSFAQDRLLLLVTSAQ